MSLAAPTPATLNGQAFRFGIAAARFNQTLVDALLERVVVGLRDFRVRDENIAVVRVPGSHEVPWAAHALAAGGQCDCVIGLGLLIAGETNHHEMVGDSVSHALQRVALNSGIPVINGVIVVNSLAQGKARCMGRINRGAEFAAAAAEMAALRIRFSR